MDTVDRFGLFACRGKPLCGFWLASLLACLCIGSAMAGSVINPPLLLASAGNYGALGGSMAGYVLNAETGMNRVYTQKLNQDLLNPAKNFTGNPATEEPVIQYVGPPPQAPPIGPLFERSTQARPLLPRH